MRQVLVDHARRRAADKRGGGTPALTLGDAAAMGASTDIDTLALEQALQQLEAHDARKARVVELRYFAGLSEQEIADLCQRSERSIRRDWQKARMFLLASVRED